MILPLFIITAVVVSSSLIYLSFDENKKIKERKFLYSVLLLGIISFFAILIINLFNLQN